jgi:hypothetical protein
MGKFDSELRKKIKNSKIVDRPIKYCIEDYRFASNEYLGLINPKKNKIKSVYQVGSVGVPGISDIDYILVFSDEEKDNYGKYHIINLSQKSKYLFAHNCILINERIMSKLNLWFPFFDLDKVYGKEIAIDKRTSKEISLILTLQYLINKVPSDFILFSTLNGKIRQRTLLALINSLRHTINLAYSLNISHSKKWDAFVNDFNLFRKNWFIEKRKDEKLVDFIFQAVNISFELISTIDKYLVEELGIKTKENSFKLLLRNKTLIFEKNWGSLGNKINSFPISFGVFIYLWVNSGTKIGDQILKKVPKEIVYSCPERLKKKFIQYASILEEYDAFSKEKFNMAANGYHTLWMPCYENPVKNWLHNKLFKLFASPYIILNKSRNFLQSQSLPKQIKL